MIDFTFDAQEQEYTEIAPQEWLAEGYQPTQIALGGEVWKIKKGWGSYKGSFETADEAIWEYRRERDWVQVMMVGDNEIGGF